MNKETNQQRTERILRQLKEKYPNSESYDLDGRGLHFVCEVEPVKDHSEYDRAVEVIIASKPHKHLRMTQHYKVYSGTLHLHVDDKIVVLSTGDTYVIKPGVVHWATSDDECWVELYSEPGWTKDDHITAS